MPDSADSIWSSVDDDISIATEPSEDGNDEELDEEELAQDEGEDESEGQDDESEDDQESDDEEEQEDGDAPDPIAQELASLKEQQAQSTQLNNQLIQVAQGLKRELDEFKASQAPQEAKPAPNSLLAKMEPEKAQQYDQLQSEWFQLKFGKSPEEFIREQSQISQSQQQVIGETNRQKADAYLQERVRGLSSEVGEEEMQALSLAAKSTYVSEDNTRIADMDPSKPWNIPPDLAMKAALGDRYLSEKRQSATKQSKARKAKVAKRDSADLASERRTDKGGEFALPEGFEDMTHEQAMDALLGTA